MRTFDYTDEKYFRLHACFLWTINDVPALVTCEDGVRKDIKHALLVKKMSSFRIKVKKFFKGQQRYLPSDHSWRQIRQHDRKPKCRPSSIIMHGEEILQ